MRDFKIKLRISCAPDAKRSYVILMYFVVEILNLTIKNVLPISDSAWNLLSYFLILLMFIAMVMVLPDAISKNKTFFFLAEAFMLGVYSISYLRGFALNAVLLRGAFWTMGVGVPLATLVYSIHDYIYLLNGLKKIAYLLSVLLWIVLFNMRNTGTYNMSASYALVVPTLVILDEFFKRYRVIDIIFPVVSMGLTIFWGSRGPLLCIGVYIIVYFFFYLRPTKFKALLFVVGMLMFFTIVFARNEIVKCIADIYIANDRVDSYVLRRLVSGTLFGSSGRDILVMHYIQLLNEYPIFGLGLYGGWTSPGDGPHNMLIEYLTEFGYPMGIMVSVFAVFVYIIPFLIKRGVDKRLLFIFFALNIPLLWVRGVWTEQPEWFMFMAMSLSVWRKKAEIGSCIVYNKDV